MNHCSALPGERMVHYRHTPTLTLACILLAGAALSGCSGSGSGGSGGGSNSLHAGSLMFIRAQLDIYTRGGQWTDFNGDGYVDYASYTIDRQNDFYSYVSFGTASDILGRAKELADHLCSAAADFNEDGLVDLACVETFDETIGSFDNMVILLLQDDREFAGPIHVQAVEDPNHPYAVYTGHFDMSPFIDLVVAAVTTTGFELFVLSGNGDGTFDLIGTTEPPAGFFFEESGVADLNNDGFDDLVERRTVKLALGDGTFDAAMELPLDSDFPAGPVDLDGDGFPEFVTVTRDITNWLTVYWGDAAVSYQSSTRIDLPANLDDPSIIEIADLDGNGTMDLVIQAREESVGGQTVHHFVMYGTGDGTFASPEALPVEQFIAAIDLDRDGHVDVLGRGNTGVYPIAFGNGDGTFRVEAPFSIPAFPNVRLETDENSFALDLDGDGHLDILGRSGANALVRYGLGDGTFEAGQPVSGVPYTNPFDLDSDGDQDFWSVQNAAGLLTIWRTYDRDDFRMLPAIPLGLVDVSAPTFKDFDGDSLLDVFVPGDAVDGILCGLGEIRFEPVHVLGPASGGGPPETHDVNGDGLKDIVTCAGSIGGDSVSIFVRLRTGPRTYGPLVQTTVNLSFFPLLTDGVRFADLNADRRSDAFVTSIVSNPAQAYLSILNANADGSYTPAYSLAIPNLASLARNADLDSDGDQDLVVLSFAITGGPNIATSLINDGSGAFEVQQQFVAHRPGLIGSERAWLVDLTGEGIADIVYMNTAAGLSVSLGQGDGTYHHPYFFDIVSTTDFAFGDYDEDGDTDIVAVSTSGDAVNFLENRYIE